MSVRTLLLLGLAASVAAPRPASPDEVLPPITQDARPQVASSSTSPTLFVTPEDRVAAMVREALRAPDQDENWACLDLALSEMNAPAGEGQPFDSQTQRVADTLACATGSSAGSATPSSLSIQTPPGGSQNAFRFDSFLSGAWQRVNPLFQEWSGLVEGQPLAFPGLLLAVGMALFWVGRRSVRVRNVGERRRGNPRRSLPFRPRDSRTGESAQSLALALWQGGLPSTEIARRTGLAQDALAVLLAINGKEQAIAASGPRHPAPPNPYARMGMERN